MLREHPATAPTAAQTDPTVAAAVSRLGPEFSEQAGLRTVERIVVQARHDLDGVPPLALPELLERLARQRLNETAGR